MHYGNRGVLLGDTGKLGEALASYQKANDIWERLASENPTVVVYQSCLASMLQLRRPPAAQHREAGRGAGFLPEALDTSAKVGVRESDSP